MAIQVKQITRRYLYNGVTLPDIPGHSAVQVRDVYSIQYPELLSAEIQEGEIANGVQEITFKRAVGTKGCADDSVAFREALAHADEVIPGSLVDQLQRKHGAQGRLRTGSMLCMAAKSALQVARGDHRPDRVQLPALALPPLP